MTLKQSYLLENLALKEELARDRRSVACANGVAFYHLQQMDCADYVGRGDFYDKMRFAQESGLFPGAE